MGEPGGFRHRRREKRPSSCRFGCLGCLNYKTAASALTQQDGASPCSTALSDDDDHPSKKERTLDDIYTNGSSLFAKCKDVSEPPKWQWELELEEELERTPYDDLVCKICKKGDADPEMLLCDGCDEGFHMYCLCPILIKVPKGKWFCPFCSKKDRVAGSGFFHPSITYIVL